MVKQLKSYVTDKDNWCRIAVFSLVFILNILTVKTSDDLGYSINNGFIDIFRREYHQYMTWTGRSVAHIIARFFLSMPKVFFNVFNSLIFCVQIELIGKHAAGPGKKVSPLLYSLIALTVFLYVPLFGQTVLWETGSCNYLWTTVIILAFLYRYRMEIENSKKERGIFVFLFFLAGLAAGWTNENTGGACILMVVFYLVFFWKKKSIRPWMIAGLAGSCIGFLIMIKAPGNAIRSLDFVNEGGKAYVLVHDLFNAIDVFASRNGQIVLWLAFGVLTALSIVFKEKEKLGLGSCYSFSGMAAVLAIIISPVPVYFDRSMYGATILIITGIAVLLAPLLEKKEIRTGGILALALMSVVASFRYGRAIVDLSYTRYQYQNREDWVLQQKDKGNVNPVVPRINNEFFTTYNAMYGLNDILDSPTFVNNENYAVIHGLESVVSTSPDKWNQLYRYGDPLLMNTLDFETYLDTVSRNNRQTMIVTCSTMTDRDRPLQEILAEHTEINELKNASNFILICSPSETDVTINQEPVDKEFNLDGHYVWVSSSDDPMLTDILTDGQEVTNDIEGISIAVFDHEQGRIVDSVTWNPDYGTRGQRFYVEK